MAGSVLLLLGGLAGGVYVGVWLPRWLKAVRDATDDPERQARYARVTATRSYRFVMSVAIAVCVGASIVGLINLI